MAEQRMCADCGNVVWWSRGWKCRQCAVIHDGPVHPTVCGCGSADFYELQRLWDDMQYYCDGCGPGRIGYQVAVRYPYFDKGLGRQITSPQHRKDVCRELGVIPTEGESRGLWEEIADREQSLIAEDEAKYDAYVTEMTEGPARGEYALMQRMVNEDLRKSYEHTRNEDTKARHMWEREVERRLSRGQER